MVNTLSIGPWPEMSPVRPEASRSSPALAGAFVAAVWSFVEMLSRNEEERAQASTAWSWLTAGDLDVGQIGGLGRDRVVRLPGTAVELVQLPGAVGEPDGTERPGALVRDEPVDERDGFEQPGAEAGVREPGAVDDEHQVRARPGEHRERLDALLGHPARDPHGDPVPRADGSVERPPAVLLASLPPGARGRVARIDDEDLPVTPDTVLVLRGCGPRGYPGMPEVANLPLPKKMLQAGVRDMVRICDGRMSGTAYGTVVLHVAPEAAAGGLLALVQDGDPIVLDVPRRLLQLDVPDEELARRSAPAALVDGFAAPTRGWERLYVEHVQQADTGVDLDFLVGSTGPGVARESH